MKRYEFDDVLSAVDRLLSPLIDHVFGSGRGRPPGLVVVKPNWIQESHEYRPHEWETVITHPTVVATVVEVLAEKMDGVGTVCICDAPHTYADFRKILSRGQLEERLAVVRWKWPGLSFECLDLRREVCERREEVVIAKRPNAEDPRDYVRLDLGRDQDSGRRLS